MLVKEKRVQWPIGLETPALGWSHNRDANPVSTNLLAEDLATMPLKGIKCFYFTTHSTHFIYGYMASDIWLRIILTVRKETCCRHIGYSYQLIARVLLYAPSHRQDSTYHGICYTNRGAVAGTKNSSMGSPHEGSIRRPIAPWANGLTTELHFAPYASYLQFQMLIFLYIDTLPNGISALLLMSVHGSYLHFFWTPIPI